MIRMGQDSRYDVVEQFERELAEFFGVKHVIALSSGSMADIIALAVLKYKFPEKKKVLVPALTFIAQVNAVIHNGLEPVFYDLDGSTKEPIELNEILCYFPVHLLGKPVRWNDCPFPIVEDACEAFGSKLNGKYVGTLGDMGTFSFYSTHSISTGEGGCIVTNNDEYAVLAKKLRNHGSVSYDDPLQKFHFDMIGFNGKMPAVCAEEGLKQMKLVSDALRKRHDNFIAMDGQELEDEYIVPHGFPAYYENRDEKMRELLEKGIDCRTIFSCIPTQEKAYEYLGYKEGDFPMAEKVGRTGLYVPCHQNLTEAEVVYIKSCL